MKRIIQAVLFDLGDTLMYSPDAWPPVYEQAGRKLSDFLSANQVSVDISSFYGDFLERLEQYYSERDHNLVETTTLAILQEVLSDAGQHDIPDDLLRLALDEFYKVTEQNWVLESDAKPTLAALHNAGVRLGMISNAGDDKDVNQLVDNFGIRHYFDFILTSAACGYRKPHPRIFGLSLEKWGYLPDEIAMVGDRLDADISGAHPLGIYSIWIRRRAKKLFPILTPPDAIVESLSDVPELVLTQLNV